MGIQGRDYMRDRSVLDGTTIETHRIGWPWITTVFFGVLLVAWLVYAGSWGRFDTPGASTARSIWSDLLFRPGQLSESGGIHQVLTCLWFHDAIGIGHIFSTLAMLLLFGPWLERSVGHRRVLVLVLGGALASVMGAWAAVLFAAETGWAVFGATGGAYALVGAAIRSGTGAYVNYFGTGPFRLRSVAGVALVVFTPILLVALDDPRMWHGIPFLLGHLAAVAFGFLLARHRPVAVAQRPLRQAPPAHSAPEPETDAVKERVDRLLAKIGAEGMDALTDEERRFLEEASKRF